MNMPPAVMHLRALTRDGRTVHVWLPLFLLWPLLLVLGVLAFVLTLLVDAALLTMGRRYHHYTLLLFRLLEMTTELRGLVVHVRRPDEDVVDLVFQ